MWRDFWRSRDSPRRICRAGSTPGCGPASPWRHDETTDTGSSASPEDRTRGRIASQLEYELDLARQVQRSLFPSPLPALRGARLAALNQPARIVSGDLYDVIVIDPERVAILCADVSGKGFPAALMAAEVQAYVRATLRAACVFADTSLGPLPVQVVTLVNHELSRHYGSGRYATMFFAEYDSGDRTLRYVNAGQNAPLLMVPGTNRRGAQGRRAACGTVRGRDL